MREIDTSRSIRKTLANHSESHPLMLNVILIPSSQVSTMILEAFRQRVIPFVSMEYGGEGIVTLDEESVYVEHYQPYHEVRCPCILSISFDVLFQVDSRRSIDANLSQ